MDGAWRRERIESWVGDFCGSEALRLHAPTLGEYAPDILTTFLEAACQARDVEPDAIEEPDVKAALLGPVAQIEVPPSLRDGVPALVAGFLEQLEAEGRLGGGRSLGTYAKALGGPYREAATGRTRPIVNPAEKVGRNDPCPCGSGQKYKKCCMGRLGT